LEATAGIELVQRRWRLVAAVTVLTAIVAFLASYLWTPRYTATTNVLVRPLSARFMTSTGQDPSRQSLVVPANSGSSLGETYGRLLTSRALAGAVVDDLHLDKQAEDPSPLVQARHAVGKVKTIAWDILVYGYYEEPSPYDAAVGAVQGGLAGTPVKDSYVLEVKASADKPELAAAIANSAAKHLVEQARQRDLADAATHRDFLKEQLGRTSDDVQAAAQAVSTYKQQNGLTDIDTTLTLNAKDVDSTRQDLADNDVQLAAARAELSELKRQMGQVSTTDSNSSTIETGRSTTTLTTTNGSTVYAQLRAQVATASGEVASLQAKHEALVAEMTDGEHSANLPPKEAKLKNLELQLAAANDAYKVVRTAYDQSVTDSQNGTLELSQVDRAGPPLYPSSPLRYLFLLIGLLVGVTGGVGLAYLRDRRGRIFVSEPALAPRPRPMPAPQPAYSVVSDALSEGEAASRS
jgi:uncharacterized protein involved in exopolysaccharide biosynthesis